MKKLCLFLSLLFLGFLFAYAQESGIPKGVYIGYTKSLGNSFNVPIKDGFQVEYLNDKEGVFDFSFPFTFARSYEFTDVLGQNATGEVLSLDMLLNFQITKPNRGLTPKLFAGPGILYETTGQAVPTVVLGAKLEFPLQPQKYDLVLGFQHRIGLNQGNQQTAVRIGIQSRISTNKVEEIPSIADDDLDGIPNEQDQCPFTPGLPELFGCSNTADEIELENQPEPEPITLDEYPIEEKEIAMEEINEPQAQVEIVPEKEEIPPVYTLPGDMYFAPNESFLSSALSRALDQVKEILLINPDLFVLIKGHTDSRGGSKANKVLSEKRAKICYEYLKRQNINPLRMNYLGYGEERPIETNKYEWGRRKNRRVEFEFYQKQN